MIKNQYYTPTIYALVGASLAILGLYLCGKLRVNEKYEAKKTKEELLSFLNEVENDTKKKYD
jgi:hypothetical protein